MKYKTTKKDMNLNYKKILGVGYCDMQHILKYRSAIAYSTRAEGWACDYYDIGGVLISTGYAPIKSKNTHCNYEIVHEYDNKAAEVYNNPEAVEALLQEFIRKITV